MCIATNAVRETLEICLKKLIIIKFISFSFSNDDVKTNKPHPEIYLKCLIKMWLKPAETLIFEDSPVGLLSAKRSGANYIKISSLKQISWKFITRQII